MRGLLATQGCDTNRAVTEPRFEGCEIIRLLRAGPATDWYLARQTALHRTVVVKSLGSHILPESPFALPLEREAQLLSQLRHPNLLSLHDFKREGERMWLVLEHVDGWSLEELLVEVRRLGIPTALAIARELVVALDHVHHNGLVHRDVRPRNVFVSRRAEVKLGNFYLAAEVGTPPPPELLEGNSDFPDLSYMSPEQILGEHTDARSDLFAVGVILYEMVSGQRPFEAGDNRTTAQRIRHEPPRPLPTEVPLESPLLERIVQRALSKMPSDRFADAAEMLLLLDMALAEYQVSPREALLQGLVQASLVEGRPTRAPRTPVRHKGLLLPQAAAVCGLLLALFLAGVYSIHRLFARPERERVAEATELPLKPADAAALRVLARPWAHVFVDGQHVETTPFANPIPLRPGVHYLRFEHPNSAPVPRRIELLPGQNLLLEVDMPMPQPTRDPNEMLVAPVIERDGGRSP